jgi:glycosidase
VTRSASAVAAGVALALVAAGAGFGAAALQGGGSVSPPSGEALASLAAPAPAPALASERIYFVLTDRYANGDPSNDTGGHTGSRNETGYDPSATGFWHGGDFKGLTGDCTDPVRGLARLKNLGFNSIWVTPPVVNQIFTGSSAGYHGYWGLDFTNVDPHLGTNQDFANFTACAHSLGMKVIMDVVVNHTGDIVQLSGGAGYDRAPYRDCHGKKFDPAAYVGKSTFPCLTARFMPRAPFVLKPLAQVKKPDWLNDPLNYHDRGDIDFNNCDQSCYEQGDFFGLDDLFTEKPNVEKGLAQVFSDWVNRYKLDGFRVDTARHVNARFFKLWVPQIQAAAKAAGVRDFQIFGEVFIADAIAQSAYVRDRGVPSVLDFPLQSAATGYASGTSSALAILHRLQDDDYYRLPDGADPAPPTFLGNHDMGRAAQQISQQGGGLSADVLLPRVLLGYDLLYLMRGAPVVYYGDEVGMIGTGGDQAARQDMFPTQVQDWQTQPRVGSTPIGKGSSFDVTNNPIETELTQLGALRDDHPALSRGWSVVRFAKGGVLAVSRIDPVAKKEILTVFNNTADSATVRVTTATPSTRWSQLHGGPIPFVAPSSDASGSITVPVNALNAVVLEAEAEIPAAAPATPRLVVRGDDLTNLWVAAATVAGNAPISVAFAVHRGGSWQRLAVDTAPPYRAFLDPLHFKKNERVQLVAIARSLDGRTAVSAVVPFRMRAR